MVCRRLSCVLKLIRSRDHNWAVLTPRPVDGQHTAEEPNSGTAEPRGSPAARGRRGPVRSESSRFRAPEPSAVIAAGRALAARREAPAAPVTGATAAPPSGLPRSSLRAIFKLTGV